MQVSLTGEKSIDNILRNLDKAVAHPIMSAAHFRAATPLVHREHLLAPVGNTGNLAESIGAVKMSRRSATEVGEVQAGPRGRKGSHGRLVEYGTRKRGTRRGANRGVMPKHPFAKPAFNQTKSEVEGRIGREVAKSLLNTMRRYNRAA